jgi:hypothetical protein
MQPIDAVTSVWPGMPMPADRRIPSKLAASIGVRHTIDTRQHVGESDLTSRRKAVIEHTDGQVPIEIATHMTYAQASPLPAVGFGGLCFEIGRCFYWRKLGSAPPGNLVERFHGEPLHDRWHSAYGAWGSTLPDEIPLVKDWRDRFYLEQRPAGWASASQKCNDMLNLAILHPVNCARLFLLPLQMPEADRRARPHRELS